MTWELQGLLWIYLLVMFVLIVLVFCFTIFAFVVTNNGAGEVVSRRGFKEYRLGDYSNWLQKRVNDGKNWKSGTGSGAASRTASSARACSKRKRASTCSSRKTSPPSSLEYWAFELLVLLAGLMPNSGMSTSLIAICTRVSNELGAGNVGKAKNAVAVALKLSILLALTIVLLLVFGHDVWASAFSDSHAIMKEFASMTPLLAVSILLDSAQGVLSGVSRGCGWQHLAAWTNLAAFYGVGMPIAVLLGFKFALHDKGLWIGLICGLSSQACTLLFITLRTNWARLELSVHQEALPNHS